MNLCLYKMPLGKFVDTYNFKNKEERISVVQTIRDQTFNGSYCSQITSYIVRESLVDSLDEKMFKLGAECGNNFYDVSNCNPIRCAQLLSQYALCLLANDNIYTDKIIDFDVVASEFYTVEFLLSVKDILNEYLSNDEYMAHFYNDDGVKAMLDKTFQKKMNDFEPRKTPYVKKISRK